MNDITAPIIRRAILDLLTDIGGEHNDDILALNLRQLGHRCPTREVREHLTWLHQQGLLIAEPLGPYIVARVTRDGRDIANGELVIEGVSRFKTGE